MTSVATENAKESEQMKCWGCEYFKIIQEPLRVGKDIYDLGRAECTNFELVVDFINHGKLKRLECIDKESE